MTINKTQKENINIFVLKMNALSSVSVESILEIGNLMIDAKTELTKNDYQEFLIQTKYAEKSASVRKWEVIGKSYLRLKPIASILPPNWSTIYKLASLKPSQLDLLQQMNILNSSVTAREIDAEIKTPKQKKSTLRLTIEINSDLDMQSANKLIDSINCAISKYSCTLKKSAELEELLSSAAFNSSSLKLAA